MTFHSRRKSVHLLFACFLFPFSFVLSRVGLSLPFFSSLLFLPSPLFLSPSFFFPLPTACCVRLVSPANMAHSSDYVRIAPDRSRSRDEPICGRIGTSNNAVNIGTHGMRYHQYLDFGTYLSSSTLKQFVQSCAKSMVMSWIQQPARRCPLSAEWKNLLCSPTMS